MSDATDRTVFRADPSAGLAKRQAERARPRREKRDNDPAEKLAIFAAGDDDDRVMSTFWVTKSLGSAMLEPLGDVVAPYRTAG